MADVKQRTQSLTYLKFLVYELQWESINPKSRRIKSSTLMEENSLDREILRQSAQIERSILSLQVAEIETARIRSLLEDAQKYIEQLELRCSGVSKKEAERIEFDTFPIFFESVLILENEFQEWRWLQLQLSNRSYCVGQ